MYELVESTSLHTVLTILYLCCVSGLMIYGVNAYVMVWLFKRKKGGALSADTNEQASLLSDPLVMQNLPTVTVQLPVFNERHVAVRAIRAAGAMTYPSGRLCIQVIDDSTDETREMVDGVLEELRSKGISASVIRRMNRNGYKAGALENAMGHLDSDLVAIFDADFVPPQDFLLRTVPVIAANKNLACVQARWGHLNGERSLLTRAQSVGIDGHFGVEQGARSWNGLFMNFNGTGGVWRTEAIRDAGGWQAHTLTEDLDLSYRAQLKGWRIRYLLNVVVPAEIPESLRAFQRQQFRWAKGSIETAKKLQGRIWSSPRSFFEKFQTLLHMTHYLIHPLMLFSVLLTPWVLFLSEGGLPRWLYLSIVFGFCCSALAPNLLYVMAVRTLTPKAASKRLRVLPFLSILGVGLCVNNTRAVLEAFIGHKSPFLRTPKNGSVGNVASTDLNRYALAMNWSAPIELLMAIYTAWGCWIYFSHGHWMVGPFLFLYFFGFTYCAVRGIREGMASETNAIESGNLLRRRLKAPALAVAHEKGGAVL